MLEVKAGNEFLGGDSFTADPLFLFGEEFVADTVCIVRGQKLSFLLIKPAKTITCLPNFAFGDHLDVPEVASHGITDRLPLQRRKLDHRVVTLDGGLDCLHTVVALRAATTLAGDTDEVLVHAAAAIRSRVDEPAPALGAENAAAQIMVVPPGIPSALTLRCQDRLYLFEHLVADDRLVTSRVRLARVSDDADVVRVSKHLR